MAWPVEDDGQEQPVTNARVDFLTADGDIDVFQQNVSNLSPDAVLDQFAKLREMKNRAFFGSITDKTLEMLWNGSIFLQVQ